MTVSVTTTVTSAVAATVSMLPAMTTTHVLMAYQP